MTATRHLMTAADLIFATLGVPTGQAAADDVVLVHGLNSDGGVWRAVFDRLTARGRDVTVAQLPLTSVEDDVAAVSRIVAAQAGPVGLVGHSYGGMVISQSGTDPKVEALVYVAAFQPEVGESLAALNAAVPAELPADAVEVFEDGFFLVEPEAWIRDVVTGLPEAEARFTAQSQAAPTRPSSPTGPRPQPGARSRLGPPQRRPSASSRPSCSAAWPSGPGRAWSRSRAGTSCPCLTR